MVTCTQFLMPASGTVSEKTLEKSPKMLHLPDIRHNKNCLENPKQLQ